MSEMLKSSGAMASATLLSRILGVVRESLYAAFMGDGVISGAFKLAFTIPNLFRRLLGEGALTAAFIPIFKEKEKTGGEKEMWHAANAVITALIIVAAALSVLVVLGISVLLETDSPGSFFKLTTGVTPASLEFKAPFPDPGWMQNDTRLMFELLRIMFPYMLFICLTAIFMGMLNARGRFFTPAMGTNVMNIIMIVTVLFVAPRVASSLDHQVFALAVAVLVAGLAQALYQLPALRVEGFRFAWTPPWQNETVRQVGRKMIPGMLGVAAFQFNVLITQGIAWNYDPIIVASFDYAVRLMELPQGLFGISLATYLLPTLSGLAAEKRYDDFRSNLRQGLGYLALANLLASVLLVTLAVPIVRLLFERGEFNSISTHRVSFALACLAPGLVAFSVVNILARAFYALGDMNIPMRISAFCLVINVVLTFFLIQSFQQGGLGIANTLSACLNAALLIYALRKKLKRLEFGEIRQPLMIMASAALVAGVVAWFAYRAWESYVGHHGLLARIGAVFVPALLAACLYFGTLVALKIPQALDYWQMAKRGLRKHE